MKKIYISRAFVLSDGIRIARRTQMIDRTPSKCTGEDIN